MNFLKSILFLVLSFICFHSSNAQVNNTGAPQTGVITSPVCAIETDGDETQLLDLSVYFTGTQSPIYIGRFKATGGVYSPPVGTVFNFGFCQDTSINGGEVGAAAVAYEIIQRCDDDEPIFTLYSVENNIPTIRGNFKLDGSAHTLTGPTYTGDCIEEIFSPQTKTATTNTVGSFSSGQKFLSYSICNSGTINGTITVSGTTTTLRPGQCYHCEAFTLRDGKRLAFCSNSVSWDATGTVFDVATFPYAE